MKTSTLSILAKTTGDGRNDDEFFGPVTLAGSPAAPRGWTLAVGANTVTFPATTRYLAIVPDPKGTAFGAKQLGGSTTIVQRDLPVLLEVPVGTTSLAITTDAVETVEVFAY